MDAAPFVGAIPSNGALAAHADQLETERTMRKLLLAVMFAMVSALVLPAHAGEYDTLRVKLTAARESLLTMMLHKEKRVADYQKVVKDTADAVSAQLATMKAPAGKEALFKELNENWSAFKQTRETELVPAILNGEDAKAKKIAGGIQKDRYTRCQEIVSLLNS
jgi:hypothetical protein